ncbi:MAG: glycosyltransferase involved in cell wall biosynthesis [Bacteroidia bacterium]
MLNDKKIAVVLPAYNAAKTLEQTFVEIPFDVVDEVILVDDASSDETIATGKALGIKHIVAHSKNRGYGGNQKSCYAKALELKVDVVIMLHPDYQYTPKLLLAMASIITNEVYPVVYGSRILGKGALKGGMPMYKYFANRVLTLTQNILMNQKLSEYHTGYRAFDTKVFDKIDIEANSDDFVFDNEMTAQIFYAGFEIGEITCPTKYFDDASSINFSRSVKYGLGVLRVSFSYFLNKLGLLSSRIFKMK